MELEGRVAVITGASGGLGRVVAQRFAREGARLALFSRDADHLKVLVEELELPEERWLTRAVDLAEPGAARDAAEAVLGKFGRLDIFLHLVGGWTGGKRVVEVPPQDVAQMLQQHVWTTFHGLQAFVPPLLANRWGRVLVVSSPLATRPQAKSSPYALAKAAEETMILTLAQELAHSGVTANVLQVRTIDVQHERDRQPTPQNASWTTPEEIAATMVYLCSQEARVINGARIPLFGGP